MSRKSAKRPAPQPQPQPQPQPPPSAVVRPEAPEFSIAIGDGASAQRPLELVIKIRTGTFRTLMTLPEWAVVYTLIKKLIKDPEEAPNG